MCNLYRMRTENAFIEAFNRRFRAECLNVHWFLTVADAVESWRLGAETTTRAGRMGPSAASRRSRS